MLTNYFLVLPFFLNLKFSHSFLSFHINMNIRFTKNLLKSNGRINIAFSEHKFLFRSLCTLHLNGGKCNALRSRMALVLYFNLLALSMYLYMLGVLFPMCRCNAFASNLICQFVHSFVIKPLLTHTKYSFDTSSCYHSVLIIFRPDA